MYRFTILLVFLFIVFIQFNQQQAANIHQSSLDDIEEPLYPSSLSSYLLNSWYNRLNNDIRENEQQKYVDHLWKRFLPDLSTLQQQRRRFGNTRYGRSLPNNWK